MNVDKRIDELNRQISTTNWDLSFIINEKTKMLKLQRLEDLTKELSQLKQMEVE